MKNPVDTAISPWPADNRTPAAYRIQILDRMFEMLDLLNREQSGLGLMEMSRRLGLHKSTAHRLMMVLESRGFIERESRYGKYRLGPRLMELGLTVLSRTNVDETARPQLRQLAQLTGETAHLGILMDGDVLSIVNIEGNQTVRTPSTVGSRTPAHCTSLGKAILSFSSEEFVESFIKKHKFESYTPNTITSVSGFREELCQIRKQGYAVDNEEREIGLRCIGAPVRDYSGEVYGAIGVAAPAFRVTPESLPRLAQLIKSAAARISESLGYRDGKSTETIPAPQD
jgi:DNA-binding IclR family transcriptional regulator